MSTGSSSNPDVSDEHQWSLLRQLHESPKQKLGPFLKAQGFPQPADKPFGKYYAQIRNKNMRVLGLPVDSRLAFIDEQLRPAAVAAVTAVKELPSLTRTKLIDIIAGLSVDGKRKLMRALSEMSVEDQAALIEILGAL
jgi:hypothetical protein